MWMCFPNSHSTVESLLDFRVWSSWLNCGDDWVSFLQVVLFVTELCGSLLCVLSDFTHTHTHATFGSFFGFYFYVALFEIKILVLQDKLWLSAAPEHTNSCPAGLFHWRITGARAKARYTLSKRGNILEAAHFNFCFS